MQYSASKLLLIVPILGLVLLLSPILGLADSSIEVVGGSLTYHPFDTDHTASYYTDKVSNNGKLIDNPLLGIQYSTEDKDYYKSAALFVGDNSIGQNIAGFKVSEGFKTCNFYVGAVLGAYEQDDSTFSKDGITPFQIAKTGTTGIVPVVGGEVNYKVIVNREMYLKLNNIISPAITNTTLSLGFSF
jgi:hypothetical protein